MNYYKLEIEKIAAQAWKKNFGNLSEKSIQRLMDAGILDHKKELAGLKKGTENIVTKGGGVIDTTRTGRHLKKQIRQTTKAMKVKNQAALEKGIDPNSLRGKIMGSLTEMSYNSTNNAMRKGNRNFVTVPPLSDKIVGGIGVGNIGRGPGFKGKRMIEMQGAKDPFANFKKKVPNKFDREYINAIFARHEADEFRASKKLISKGDYQKIGDVKMPMSKRVFSHLSPEVLHRESPNVAIAPSNAKKFLNDMRDASFEKGYLSNYGLDYGKSGVFDKKLSAKNVKDQFTFSYPMI